MATCTGCGIELATADVLYTTRGDVVCVKCNDKAELAGDEDKAAQNIKRAAIVSAIGGVFGFGAISVAFVLGFYAAAIITVSSGVFAINGLMGSDSARFAKLLTRRDRTITWIALAIGLAATIYEALVFNGTTHIHVQL
ncbi:MAG TPA: hypothetical protein VGG28_27320 [Kofleriaceae bacterium]|jgi:hypothetical protein